MGLTCWSGQARNVKPIALGGVGWGDMRTDNREQRLTRISDRGYELIAKGTPASVARGLGLILFVAEQRERDDQARRKGGGV